MPLQELKYLRQMRIILHNFQIEWYRTTHKHDNEKKLCIQGMDWSVVYFKKHINCVGQPINGYFQTI